MFKFLSKFFGIEYLVNYGENTMARIVSESNGRANLVVDGNVIASYARARDARRGASRRGLTVA
jgi:adenine-specific DNA glycosylase